MTDDLDLVFKITTNNLISLHFREGNRFSEYSGGSGGSNGTGSDPGSFGLHPNSNNQTVRRNFENSSPNQYAGTSSGVSSQCSGGRPSGHGDISPSILSKNQNVFQPDFIHGSGFAPRANLIDHNSRTVLLTSPTSTPTYSGHGSPSYPSGTLPAKNTSNIPYVKQNNFLMNQEILPNVVVNPNHSNSLGRQRQNKRVEKSNNLRNKNNTDEKSWMPLLASGKQQESTL